MHGHIITSGNPTLYLQGYQLVSGSCDLLTTAIDNVNSSGDLTTTGHSPTFASGNLFIESCPSQSASGNLFVEGYIDTSGVSASGNLFNLGHEIYSKSATLFMGTILVAKQIDWLLKSSDHYPQILGTLEGASGVNIQLWEITDGQNTSVPITVSGCYQIGNTGRWAWSTANLPTYTTYQQQYFYLMTADNNETFDGQFFLELPEGAKWIHPSSQSEYIK